MSDAATRSKAATTALTRATVSLFLERLGGGDPDLITELFAPEVDWLIAENPAVPWIRPRRTRSDVAAHFRALAAGRRADPDGTAIEAVVVEGEEAMISGFLAGTVHSTGKYFRSPFATRLTVRGGQITRFRVYEDSLAVAAACTP
ncbi:nuclear transport factor 2 family protein [Streptomyces yaizuensis]|uniref:Nuclear transport factor 2 family protein n=1 Tax=Streptomyces yaizuensis TaxID=2989713 RepID=A0ABQ5P967_9ACTN|nr:nuclear transport factor 2 family protein [Streptomyces sp. YSPA8]GLF99020.1 nuclear transport factor 2 family protein [Streptomyces sp. YSPA8]